MFIYINKNGTGTKLVNWKDENRTIDNDAYDDNLVKLLNSWLSKDNKDNTKGQF